MVSDKGIFKPGGEVGTAEGELKLSEGRLPDFLILHKVLVLVMFVGTIFIGGVKMSIKYSTVRIAGVGSCTLESVHTILIRCV